MAIKLLCFGNLRSRYSSLATKIIIIKKVITMSLTKNFYLCVCACMFILCLKWKEKTIFTSSEEVCEQTSTFRSLSMLSMCVFVCPSSLKTRHIRCYIIPPTECGNHCQEKHIPVESFGPVTSESSTSSLRDVWGGGGRLSTWYVLG